MEIVKAIANVFFHGVRVLGILLLAVWNINQLIDLFTLNTTAYRLLGLGLGQYIRITLVVMMIFNLIAWAIILLGHWGLQKINPERPNLPLTVGGSTGKLLLIVGIGAFTLIAWAINTTALVFSLNGLGSAIF